MATSKKLLWLLSIIVLSGCSTLAVNKLRSLYGEDKPRDRLVSTVPIHGIDYWSDVKPILENRCVVCHACYDAPCQLKYSAIEGIERGAHPTSVYNTTRLVPADLTRLFEDAESTEEWREKGFFPVLNEHDQTSLANQQVGVMYQLLALKKHHPLPSAKILSDDFTLGISRSENCPRPENVQQYVKNRPLWGMPYALPGLEESHQKTLENWLTYGAQYTARKNPNEGYEDLIQSWESFLNQNTLKSQLSSRYIYEHLFLAHLYFEKKTNQSDVQTSPTFFKLVRSTSAPGTPVDLIASRRPYDEPGVDRVYYRLVPELVTIVNKNHMPYALNEDRLQRWKQLFIDEDYEVSWLPTYGTAQAANPFDSFSQLPMTSRYKFMLDEAQFSIMNYIKGPVCRGNAALNVINDHFWVFFVDPEIEINQEISKAVLQNVDDLELPSAVEDSYIPILPWRKYAASEKRNNIERDKFLVNQFSQEDNKLDLSMIWDGDKENPNAALTIFRHGDSATVVKGLIGSNPKTAWVISYPLLERIHYLLVAGYDVYGNVGHSLLSRLHMDFLRMDGESAFIMMLPKEIRAKEREYWYREADQDTIEFLSNPEFDDVVQTDINYQTTNYKDELFSLLKNSFGSGLDLRHDLSAIENEVIRNALNKLSTFKGESTALLAENSVIEIVDDNGASRLATLIRNNAHLNIMSIFGESKNLIPAENTVTVAKGVVGSYPNIFMRVKESDINLFVDTILAMESENDYEAMLDSYGIRRTNPDFWTFSDSIHQRFEEEAGIEFGLLDYNRLENR